MTEMRPRLEELAAVTAPWPSAFHLQSFQNSCAMHLYYLCVWMPRTRSCQA